MKTFLLYTMECDASCGLIIGGLYYVEVRFPYTYFVEFLS